MNSPGYKYKVDKRKSKTCIFCGSIFYKRFLVNKEEWDNKKFCNMKCYQSWRIGKSSPHKRRKMTAEEILNRKLTSKKAWSGVWKIGTTQSLESRIKISAKNQGISVEEWNGFKRTEDKIQRANFAAKMRKDVFERDNYTCQMCGKTNTHLQVDHIQEWSKYAELRFEMSNLRTLCDECHYLVTFGKPKPVHIKNWGHGFHLINTGE